VATWGSTTLNVTKYEYVGTENYLIEKKLIPDAAVYTPQTVLVGVGRGRKRIAIEGIATVAEFQALESDKNNFVERAVSMASIEDSRTFTTAVIEQLQGEKVKGTANNLYMFYSCVFLEVT